MKILILANDSTYTYNLRKSIIQRLIQENNSVFFAGNLLEHTEGLIGIGCGLINIKVGRHGTNPINDITLLGRYLKLLKEEKPDAVLTYNIKPNVYGGIACSILHIPYYPNVTGLGTAVEYQGHLQKLAMHLYRLGVMKAECVFFQNQDNLDFFNLNHLLSKKSRTVLLPGSGVDLTEHPVLDYQQDGKIHFLFVARIMKEKGADIYINVAKRIWYRHPETVFHICGYCDDSKYKELLTKAQKDGYLIYHGEQQNMLPFYEKADCIVHPSYYPEGISNVLLEASASARPVITTNRSGCREVVDDGVSGYIVPTKDEKAVENAIEEFLALSFEKRKKMGLAGRKKVELEFDRKIVVNKYMQELGL